MQHPLPVHRLTTQGVCAQPVAEPELIHIPERSAFERYLEVVKNVIVIVTCVAVLLSLLEAYFFIERLQQAAQEFTNRMTLGG